MNKDEALEYLRGNHLPTVWCPGCGNGIVLKAMLEAIKNLGLQKDNIAVVSGIGCSSRATGYIDFNTMHTLHGRAIAFATGVKLARPDLKVIVITGDGDAMAIGGNHFIHACRRNMDLTVIIYNNNIYGIDAVTQCPTYYGRYNKSGDAPGMMQYFKESAISLEKAEHMDQKALDEKIVIGEFVDIQKPGYVSEYVKLRESLKVKS